MIGHIILYTILFLLSSFLIGIFFIMMFTAHQDFDEKGLTANKLGIDLFAIVCIYLSYLAFDAMWMKPHDYLYEYRGTKNGESTYVTYNMFFTDSTYVKVHAADTITAVVTKVTHNTCIDHLHAQLKCEDGYKFSDERLWNITENQAKRKKYKVKREYFPDKTYTLIQ